MLWSLTGVTAPYSRQSTSALNERLDKVKVTNLETLLEYVRKWNTKSKMAEVTQSVQKCTCTC